ncbi:MAG: tRNA (adenosine(37)-N6)-threonylcarbamoyltransferase complex ATPase subunit type 1 TsaE [Bacteriovoracaceae bacterium]|nr:tRNA (adenosine(37)-N6)-threonylcarbamoyltransferase complex ATPase subunit type 1 TsaE [Bacteriovoracaceae bacterium]
MIKSWKKVFESDLTNIMSEFKDSMAHPLVLFIEGPVGAGKTTFVKAFVQEERNEHDLKPSAPVQSPSYSLINEYDSILHADLYRLEKKDDLIQLELPMYLEEKEFILIEWGERYSREIMREIGDEFKYYLLKIDMNAATDNTQKLSRNYSLYRMDDR